MSSGVALAVGLCVVAGLAGAVQAAIMGRLGERIGSFEALAFATTLYEYVVDGVALVSRYVVVSGFVIVATRVAVDGVKPLVVERCTSYFWKDVPE